MPIEPITINIPDIDFNSFEIVNVLKEKIAIMSIQRNILAFLKENDFYANFLNHPANSILMNKLVYFSSRKIAEHNRKFIISGGWYKFGPCYEDGRRSEDSLSLVAFPALKPINKMNPIIEDICAKEVPIFFKDKSEYYPHIYLSHIYEDMVDNDHIRKFYISKHNLATSLFYFMKDDENGKSISELVQKFSESVIDENFSHYIDLTEKDLDTIIDFVLFIDGIINDVKLERSDFSSVKIDLAKDFIHNILMVAAYKIYAKTFESNNKKFKRNICDNSLKKSEEFIKKSENIVKHYYNTFGDGL